MKRRELIIMTSQGIGMLALQACGGSKKSTSAAPLIGLKTIAELRLVRPMFNGQQFEVLGHTLEGIGGGTFYFDGDDLTSNDDNGSIIVGKENRYKRIRPSQPTAEMFGARVNPEIDQSVFINKCVEIYGACFLEGGQSYNIQYQVDAVVLKTYGDGVVTLNCVSPNANNKFGSTGAAVRATGTATNPLEGVDIQNIVINCNSLVNATDESGLKGFWVYRCKNFSQENCTVIKCASYAYWDNDDLELGAACKGTRNDCRAIDSLVSFGQMNVFSVTLNSCNAYISTNSLPYIPKALFHPYGGSDMSVVLNNCTGIADGVCPTIFLAVTTCKNIAANDCTFINNNIDEGLRTALYFERTGGNFDNLMFKNCIIKSAHSPAAFLDVGENGSKRAKFKFTDCKIDGYQLAVQLNSLGGVYSFVDCDTKGVADAFSSPYAYFQQGPIIKDGAVVSVIGGSATAEGPNAVTTTNMSKFIYTNTFLTPPDFSTEPVIGVKNIDELRTTIPKYDKQQFEVLGYVQEGVGGGLFYYDAGDVTSNDDGGSIIVSSGNRFKRVRPTLPTAEMFGARVNLDDDQSVFINNCMNVYGECYLEGGKTYNIQQTLEVKILKCLNGIATINCVSPTNDNRFGSLHAAIIAAGEEGNPLVGVDLQNIKVQCNRLIGVTGFVGLKGFWLFRCQSFYQRGCTVSDSASYAYWDYDISEAGTTYCSGTRDDCWAIDCSVSFEQVNVRSVTLNNCHGYISDTTLPYTIECIFHPYGGADMQVVYNNCSGVADGNCPAILLALLTCKNVTANDCTFVNNNDGDGHLRTGIYFDNSSGNFDNFSFRNCIIKSMYSPAVYLDAGGNGSMDARFKFMDCIIDGYQIGVQINGIGGVYSFINCDTTGSVDISATPFAYYANGSATGNSIVMTVLGGSATSIGPKATTTTNLNTHIYTNTRLSPAGLTPLVVRQEKIGTGVLVWNGTYSYLNIKFPFRILDVTKVIINATVNATGATSGEEAATWAAPISWVNMDNTTFRLFSAAEFAGKTVSYVMTEYE